MLLTYDLYMCACACHFVLLFLSLVFVLFYFVCCFPLGFLFPVCFLYFRGVWGLALCWDDINFVNIKANHNDMKYECDNLVSTFLCCQ